MVRAGSGRGRAAVALLAALVLAVVVLGPALGAGYVLSYDMVFVPRQTLLPASVGLGDALPRAVPQDAVVALATMVAPGWLWQHLALVAIVAVGALGAARLLARQPWQARAAASLLFVWSGYLAERLVLGAWALLLAYALLPWVLLAALAVRKDVPGSGARLLVLTALGSLVPSGGILVAGLGLPVAVGPGSRVPAVRRWGLLAGGVALQLPWVVAALVHPARGVSDPAGVDVFALRPEGPWGSLLTALGTGGAWNGDVVPGSRGTWLAPAATVLVAALAAAGLRPLAAQVGRAAASWLAVVALGGLLVALASTWPSAASALASAPGGGLLRDAQKWLAPLALLLAAAAPLGVVRVAGRAREPATAAVLLVGLALVPVALMPDLAWGARGRLAAVSYPDDWQQVRDTVAGGPDGDVAVLPWSAFRAFGWNARRPSLDPAPRWLTVPTVVDDSLLVGRRDGTVVRVSGEDPRSAAVAEALRTGRPLAQVLPPLGIGWLLVEKDQPGQGSAAELAGLVRRLDTPTVSLWRTSPALPWPGPSVARVAAVLGADAAAVGVVAAAGAGWGLAAWRRRREQSRHGGRGAATVSAPAGPTEESS